VRSCDASVRCTNISIRVELLGHLHADASSAPAAPTALMARAMHICRRVGIDADGVAAVEFTGDRAVVYQLRERVARLKRERPSAETEGRSSGGRTLGWDHILTS
jgi:hypothetical protein